MTADALVIVVGVVVAVMTTLAVVFIGEAESEDPAHGTDMSDVRDDEPETGREVDPSAP